VEPLTGDQRADAYLVRLAQRARDVLGATFVGAYVVNSGARGAYLPGRSDLDVALIVTGALDARTKRDLADALRHRGLPCPAPRLELVVYRLDVVREPEARPPFELNLNSGPAIADHVGFDPDEEPWFWFALDLGAAADVASVIDGPPADAVFGAVSRQAILEAMAASDAWHAAHDRAAPNRVLNACRAWCWVETSSWRSKAAAARWAIDAGGDAELIRRAIALRASDRAGPLPGDRVDRLAAAVLEIIEAAIGAEPPSA
jgi:hypothetical protein